MTLFPAHAGVILVTKEDALEANAVPRTRGGDPFSLAALRVNAGCSPHTRG